MAVRRSSRHALENDSTANNSKRRKKAFGNVRNAREKERGKEYMLPVHTSGVVW